MEPKKLQFAAQRASSWITLLVALGTKLTDHIENLHNQSFASKVKEANSQGGWEDQSAMGSNTEEASPFKIIKGSPCSKASLRPKQIALALATEECYNIKVGIKVFKRYSLKKCVFSNMTINLKRREYLV